MDCCRSSAECDEAEARRATARGGGRAVGSVERRRRHRSWAVRVSSRLSPARSLSSSCSTISTGESPRSSISSTRCPTVDRRLRYSSSVSRDPSSSTSDRSGAGGSRTRRRSCSSRSRTSESGVLLDNLVGSTELADRRRRQIVEAAGGNPLFVEEMVALLLEEGRERPTPRFLRRSTRCSRRGSINCRTTSET